MGFDSGFKGLISTLTVPQLLPPIVAIALNVKESTGTFYFNGNHI